MKPNSNNCFDLYGTMVTFVMDSYHVVDINNELKKYWISLQTLQTCNFL